MSDEPDAEDTVEIPNLREQVLARIDREKFDAEISTNGGNSLSEPERLWLQWFYSLTREDQQIVEQCGDLGYSANADNFEYLKRILQIRLVRNGS